jgi:hypothetical protein
MLSYVNGRVIEGRNEVYEPSGKLIVTAGTWHFKKCKKYF